MYHAPGRALLPCDGWLRPGGLSMTTIALGLGAAVCFAASDLTAVRAARTIGPLLALMLVVGLGVLPAVSLFLAVGHLPTTGPELESSAWALVSGALYYGGQLALYKGLRDGNIAVVAPIATLEGMVALAIATGLGERITVLALGGIAIALVGGVLTAIEPGGRSARGAGWGLASAVLFGLTSIAWGHTGAISTASTLALSKVGAIVLLGPIVLLVARGVPRLSARPPWRWLAVSAACELVAVGAAAASLTSGPISIASVCQSQYGTFSAVIALVLLRERLARTQLAGIAATGAGVALMAAAGG